MDNQFKNKIILITGSTDGIGLATAQVFKQRGGTVIVSSRKAEAVQKVQDNLGCDGIVCNVSLAKDRETLVTYIQKKYGKLDVFVSNVAASLSFGMSEDCEESKWDKMMDTNLKASWLLAKALVKFMPPVTSSIVFVSSIAGFDPSAPIGIYGVTKTALLGLTRLLANEFGAQYKIRVNCVAPGVIRTKFSGPLIGSDEAKARSENISPLQRIGESMEVAKPIVFLASDDASFITGETVIVAGGAHCRL